MIDIIINPIAGNGHAKHVSKKIRELLEGSNIPFRYFYTKFKGHGKELAIQSVKDGAKIVLSVGGDGTTNEIIGGLINSNTALGIIPAGTGNDFVKALNMPKDPIASLHHILKSTPKPVDVGMLNDKAFLNVCGTGIDVSVLEYANQCRKYIKGNLSYIAGLFLAITKHKSNKVKIKIDDNLEIEDKFVICSVGNGRYIGGGIPITQHADVDDSYFDIIMLQDVARLAIPFYLFQLMRGTILRYNKVNYYRAKKLEITSNTPIQFEADGEVSKLSTATIRLLAKAINIVY